MSKKLIAVASASALALSALVAAPAAAADFSVVVTGTTVATSTGLVATTPVLNASPVNNKLINENRASTTNTAVRFVITAAAPDVAITVTSTNGVKLTTTLFEADGATSLKPGVGTASLGGTSNSSSVYTFYAYSTSTATGTVVMSSGGNTKTYYLKSLAGDAYNIESVTWPTSILTAAVTPMYVKLTDVFGNAITGGSTGNESNLVVDAAATGTAISFVAADVMQNGDLTLTAVGATGEEYATATTSTGSDGDWIWVAAKAAWAAQIEGGATAGAVALRLDLAAQDRSVGLASQKRTAFTSINSSDAVSTVALLNAQVAALTAQLAASRSKATSVTKKRYNTLARKWNRANPSAKVALKK